MSAYVLNVTSQIGAAVNKASNNNLKTSSSCSISDKSFDSFMSKLSDQTSKTENVTSNDDKHSVNKVDNNKNSSSGNPDDDKKIELPEKIKTELKSIGATDEEIDNVKSLDDLKNLIEKKLLDSDNLQKLLTQGLTDTSTLGKLLTLFMPQENQTGIQDISDNIVNSLKTQINNIVKELSGGTQDDDKIAKLLDNLKNNIEKSIQTNTSNDDPVFKLLVTKNVEDKILNSLNGKLNEADFASILPKVKQELVSLLNDAAEDIKNQKVNNTDVLNNLISMIKEDHNSNNILSANYSTSDMLDSNNSNNSSDNKKENLSYTAQSKDDSFLTSLASKDDKNSSSISKAADFMTQFNNTVNNLNTDSVSQNIVINKTDLNNDIIKTLNYMESNDVKNLTVKINPRELGEVTIKLTMEAGQMKANITANTKDAYNLLNSNILDITSKLQNNDIKIQNISLGVYEDTTFFKDGSENRKNDNNQSENRRNSQNKLAGVNEEKEIDNFTPAQNNVNMLA